jgi:putative endonuclease
MNWQVYIIVCSDDTLYTGITTDIERRLSQHASGRGAKYFRGRRPKEVVYLEGGHDRSTASKRELAIKGMKRAEKESLIRAVPHSLPRLISGAPTGSVSSPVAGEG